MADAAYLAAPKTGLKIPHSEPIRIGETTKSPAGSAIFCSEYKAECIPRSGAIPVTADGAIILTDDRFRRIVAINAGINRVMRQVTDQRLYRLADKWTVGKRAGDCEDLALEKRRRLIAAGFPSSAVLLAIGRNGRGEMHAVLVVRTDKGDYVLDNIIKDVRPWRHAVFDGIKMQSPERPDQWVRI